MMTSQAVAGTLARPEPAAPEETNMSTTQAHWFSTNPDKAWAEKFFLPFVFFFFAYNAVIQKMGWLDAGNFWHVTQNALMWIPYCILLPAWLRRHSGVRWYESYWFKYNLLMFTWVFYASYFHTEYFFDSLGMRYNFPDVTLHLDTALTGPDEATALAEYKKVPVGMYLNSVAFFIVYHTIAIVCMRRVRTMTTAWSPLVQRFAWAVIVAATALFFAWAETFFYITAAASTNVWYESKELMLTYGSTLYALYFIVSFPFIYRLDENMSEPRWSLARCVVEGSAVGAISLLLIDRWAAWFGPIV
jgi:cycloeucalenol cycloisomerase